MIRTKPFEVSVYSWSQTANADGELQKPSYGSAVTVQCQIVPSTPETVKRDHGIDVKEPHILMADYDAESPLLVVNTKIVWNGRDWFVHAFSAFQQSRNTDHIQAVLSSQRKS